MSKDNLADRMLDGVDRRKFLKGGAIAMGTLAAVPGLGELWAPAHAAGRDYGPLREVEDMATGLKLLALPRGFRYTSFGWTGDPLMDGSPTPPGHDGMAVVSSDIGQPGSWRRPRNVVLVRNHEIRSDNGTFGPAPAYDPMGGGGNTNLQFDVRQGKLVKAWASLTGTITNCAGGPTPWGSWLSCEEDTRGPAGDFGYDADRTPDLTQTHGWIFDVPGEADATAIPLKDMGRFVHEAVAVDPNTWYAYETEDRSATIDEVDGTFRGGASLYRFIPNVRENYEMGGTLAALKVAGEDNADLTGNQEGKVYGVEWVTIDDPQLNEPANQNPQGCFLQGQAKGAAVFDRLEGAWEFAGIIYFVSTSGGQAGEGQVWALNPRTNILWNVFDSPSAGVADNPDNIGISPRGGILLCEDGPRGNHLLGLTPDGKIFDFARNIVRLNGQKNDISGDFMDREFAGATWDPTGRWLFVNIQTPGITFAITGPWHRGIL